jgi:plasmid stabilization system protein ParE
MRVDFLAAAARKVEDAHTWYEERSIFAAAAFLRELTSSAINRIREAPLRYAAAEHGTRRVFLEHFPFTMYYRLRGDVITTVAVAHQKRRPGYWRSR